MSFKRICSLCFSDINNENAGLITDTTKEILDLLLIDLDLGDRSDHAICNICSERLLAAFEFKSTCKYTDATITCYVDWEEPTQLDLWEIYMLERDNKQAVTLSRDEKVCRLCMELTGKMHVLLQDMDKDAFQKFLPEINMKFVKDPVVCKTCFDSFATHSNFLKKLRKCMDQKKAIKCSDYLRNIDHTDEFLPIKMEEVDIKLENIPSIDSCIQLEQTKSEIEECDQLKIKTEFENDVTSAKSLVSEIHPVAIDSKGQTIQTKSSRAKIKNRIGCRYNCDVCNHKTKVKGNPQNHCIVHQDPSKIKQFTCDLCSFRTNRASSLKRHQLVHKDPSELQMYKCDICTYETKYKAKLKYHQLVHKDPSEVQMFNCDKCEYKTKLKAELTRHQLRHKDPSEVQMYKCASCEYETKFKGWLKSHLLKHKDPSEVQMFKCASCDYETKFKRVLKSHVVKHKDPSEVPMFKCAKCSYESRNKYNISRHCFSQHRNPS